MPIRQITIIGTGLIGGSLGLSLRKGGFRGRIVGCDRAAVLSKARRMRAIDDGIRAPLQACAGSDVVILATPVAGIIDLIEKLAPQLPPETLLTDVGSTKVEIMARASKAFGANAARRFLGGHPMAGKENSGIEFADANLFRDAVWFVTPVDGQKVKSGRTAEYMTLLKKTGARVIPLPAPEHDQLCAWISHVPQMMSTALSSALVETYGEGAPLLDSGGRALREMTRIGASPYSMWRDIALTNKTHISAALQQVEQKLAHIRENLGTRELAKEFDCAHKLGRGGPASRRTKPRQNG